VLLSSVLYSKNLASILHDNNILEREISNNTSTVILINNYDNNIDVYLKEELLDNINNNVVKQKEDETVNLNEVNNKSQYGENNNHSDSIKDSSLLKTNIKINSNIVGSVPLQEQNQTKGTIINSISNQIPLTKEIKVYSKEVNSNELIEKIKSSINKNFNKDFSKSLFYSELDSLKNIKDSTIFKNKVNIVLNKYFSGEMEVIFGETSEDLKNKTLEISINNKILYIKPNTFYPNLYNDMKKFINDNKYKYDKIVINLENNEGGSLSSVHQFMNAFLLFPEDNRVIFSIQSKNNVSYYKNINNSNIDILTPIEISINKKTKLGAYMSAKVLEHFNRAIVIGENSKVIDKNIRSIIPLKEESNLYFKLVSAEFIIGKYEKPKNMIPQVQSQNFSSKTKTILKVNSSNTFSD
jgi:hypothetical protein